jgi:hypothetical protein
MPRRQQAHSDIHAGRFAGTITSEQAKHARFAKLE